MDEEYREEPNTATRNIDRVLWDRIVVDMLRISPFFSLFFYILRHFFVYCFSPSSCLVFFTHVVHHLLASHPHELTIHTIVPHPDVHVVSTSKKAIC